eukprot:TRINITY_DN116783_c0_g1_i1.p1 TRINITY_DN116783_c0_g1~~TRINITY_DN116783_c0_g1_i1.p1  ORF type:complete len:174 (+),score=22.71 TRINITY_DN116783_c0_g1_i1:398-919(+)
MVIGVGAGPVAEWNESCVLLDKCVQEGDMLLEVNGKRGTAEELAALLGQPGDLRIIFGRLPMPRPMKSISGWPSFEVHLTGPGRRGISVERSQQRFLTVLRVTFGSVQDWNDVVKDVNQKVYAGDLVVCVSGTSSKHLDAMPRRSGLTERMIDILQTCDNVTLRMVRPPRPLR